MAQIVPIIPENITVHLGNADEYAPNVTVPFIDYIKNVASGEIYPTWEQAAISANILAQISFALNRVYTEFYRSRGYDFDITSTTAQDQSYEQGRNIFENISDTVDNLFDNYIRRRGFLEPLAAKYCNGTTTTCDGLSQWGSQQLAQEGLNSVEILRYYYGDDIEIVVDAPVADVGPSYPGTPLREGDSGRDVGLIQTALNQISENYTAIPKISPVDGYFGETTREAVIEFQEIFNLTADGIVGKNTWYRIIYLYVSLRRLAELRSEGQTIFSTSLEYPEALGPGDTGPDVQVLQYMIALISVFNPYIPEVDITGVYNENTKNAVIAIQNENGLPPTGITDAATWEYIYSQAAGNARIVLDLGGSVTEPYPGVVLKAGSRGDSVRILQEYLNILSVYAGVFPVDVTGVYGVSTTRSVSGFQRRFSLPVTGEVDEQTWNEIAAKVRELVAEASAAPEQYGGRELSEGDADTTTGGIV